MSTPRHLGPIPGEHPDADAGSGPRATPGVTRLAALTVAALALSACASASAAPAGPAQASLPAPTKPAPTTAPARPGPGIDDGPLAPTQDPQIKAQAAALKKLDFFVGQWRGTGWMMTPKGKSTFEQYEVIRPKLSGQILLVEGKGNLAKKPNAIVHRALAIVGYDTAKKQYTWAAYAQGTITTTLQVTRNGWSWQIPLGQGMTMRYRATFTKTTWTETGEMTRDGGKTWIPTMGFTLKRVGR